jgi:diguanylate cyclase (GGDEF)-like protein/PAS domain S-box-containing protein
MIHVGVLSPLTGGFFFGEALDGIVREVAAAGGRVTLVQTLDAGQQWDDFRHGGTKVDPVGWQDIDGLIALTWSVDEDDVRRAQDAGKPVVLAASTLEGLEVSNVVCDNGGGARASVDHLVEHGHTRIGFVGNITAESDLRDRHVAYQAAMAAHGLAELPLLGTTPDGELGGDAAAGQLAAQPPGERCTALVGATDRTALDLLEGLHRRGIRVPEDIAVIGFDDIEASWYSTPQLTTVHQDFKEIGARAAGLLLRELADPRRGAQHVVLPAELVRRTSCGCPPNATEPSGIVSEAVDTLERELSAHFAAARKAGADADTTAIITGIDETISRELDRLLRADRSPEAAISVTQRAVRGLVDAFHRQDAPGIGPLIEHAVTTMIATLARLQGSGYLDRVTWLSAALSKQHSVGMGLLGDVDGDPADLDWLGPIGVRAGCLGLWSGTPSDGNLEIVGAYDPGGALKALIGTAVTIEQFPPRVLADLADAGKGQVTYVIPVRGSTGDHGLLAMVAGLESEFATERGTYDYWAALLGAALREKSLLEDIRHSEERYAFAARAARDGLWERDVATNETYLSQPCRNLLGFGPDVDVGSTALTDMVHPEDREKLRDALAYAEANAELPVEVEYRRLLPDGSVRWLLARVLGVAPDGGAVQSLVGSISDIDRRKVLEEQLRQAALFDAVTGLPNRRLFLDRLSVAMEYPRRRKSARFAVLFLDLDGFKLINDSLGHLMGDELLRVIGERLREDLRSVDTAARFGGDEFALLLTDPVPDDLLVVARRIQDRVSAPVLLGEQEVSITASIGIAASETPYACAEDVLRDADIAMYQAKESERGTACLFDPGMHERALDRLRTRWALTAALEAHQFVVHYQPIVDLGGADVTQFEALVRWNHPERGLLLPKDFLPHMEGNATILALGHHVLDMVCAQIALWRADRRTVAVSVNLSHRQFWEPDLVEGIRLTLDRYQIPPECLIIEITESVIMTDPTEARTIMDALHALGLRLHIDDFGTGHSSLSMLRTFPVDALKIDGSFIRELGVVAETTALVRTIVAIGQALGIDVVAECVETHEQADQLRAMGCATAQGWLYARAQSAVDAGLILGTRLAEPAIGGELATPGN